MANSKYKQAVPDYKMLISDSKDYEELFRKLISYVNYEIDNKALAKAARIWVKKNCDYDYKTLFSISDSYFLSVGKFCYIMNKGGELNDEHLASLCKILDDLYDKAIQHKGDDSVQIVEGLPSKEDAAKKRIGVQDHMRDHASKVAGEIEGWIDDFMRDPKKHPLSKRDIQSMFTTHDLKAGHLRFIILFYENDIQELDDVMSDDDAELKSGFISLSKPNIKKLRDFYVEIVKVANLLKSSSIKKPRKKRPIDKSKRVRNMKYLDEDTDMGIKSVRPHNIIGAKYVWFFNTKTRKIGYYAAVDVSGLDVTGTSIKNYSGKSVEKTLRKSANIDLVKFVKSNLTNRKKQFSELKTMEVTANGRFNEHIIILNVDK